MMFLGTIEKNSVMYFSGMKNRIIILIHSHSFQMRNLGTCHYNLCTQLS